MAGRKRRNPSTPSPKKRASRRSKATTAASGSRARARADVILPGGALQTTFRLGLYLYSFIIIYLAKVPLLDPTAAGSSSHVPQPEPEPQHHVGNDPFIAPPQASSPHLETFNLSTISSALPEPDIAAPDDASGSAPDERQASTTNLPIDPVPVTPSRWQQRANKRASGPAGNRKGHHARDVYTFFKDNNDNNSRKCTFCLTADEANSTHDAFAYGQGTAVGTLRRHLLYTHRDDWFTQCDLRGIEIKGKEAQAAYAALRA
ncbi:hypothetical protein BGW80DRAFT_1462847 [Lactifluus volemus]|nr:hypothetical protein BGW80DRAFT_1462847 [Lactifluus volemus]